MCFLFYQFIALEQRNEYYRALFPVELASEQMTNELLLYIVLFTTLERYRAAYQGSFESNDTKKRLFTKSYYVLAYANDSSAYIELHLLMILKIE